MGTSVGTKTCTHISTHARSITYVANELLRVGVLITKSRGVSDGELVHRMPVISNGLRVWLLTNEMECFHIEFVDNRGKVVERWDFPISYDRSAAEAGKKESFETQMDEVEAALKGMPPVNAVDYRVIVSAGDNPTPVEGWSPTTLGDVSHLKSRAFGKRLIDTLFVGVKAFVFTQGGSHARPV